MPTKRTVYFYEIIRVAMPTGPYLQSTQFDSPTPTDHIQRSLTPDVKIAYYNKAWRLSKPSLSSDRAFLVGKLGFDKTDTRTTVAYDDESLDFVQKDEPFPLGTFVHYAIHLETQHLVAEATEHIKRGTARTVVEKFLNNMPSAYRYEVQHLTDNTAFDTWVESVGNVKKFELDVVPPNPDYDRWPRELEVMVRDTNADSAGMSIRNNSDGGLNMKSSMFTRMVTFLTTHAKYGGFRATASDGRRFESRINRLAKQIETQGDIESERMFQILRRILRQNIRDE